MKKLIRILMVAALLVVMMTGFAFAKAPTYLTSVEEAGTQLREAMVDREASEVVYFKISSKNSLTEKTIKDLATDIYRKAIKHTGEPDEGDYLFFNITSYRYDASAKGGKDAYYYITLNYKISYRTTAKEEGAVDDAVAKVKKNLNLSGKSNYEKILAIHDYIKKNVKYDYDAANGKKNDPRAYTAYNALVKGKAVCQGYATLFYRLILEYDIDSRIITGTSFGNKHAWNIVKLDGSWYHLDTTWASTADTYEYFLKGANYADHKTDDKFKEKAFTKSYPISKTDYKTNIVDHKKVTIITPATTTKDGKIEIKCKKCGKVLSKKTIKKIGKVTLSSTKTTYNGKTKSPTVSVKDASGKTISSKYYTVKKPSGRKNVGSYVYTVTFKDHYQGKKTAKLLILPKAPTALKPEAGRKSFTAKWKKVTDGQASGFEVQYSTKKNFSSDKHYKKVKSSKAVSKKITGLKKDKTYYVRVRTYKTVGKETFYSAWSKSYSVKVK